MTTMTIYEPADVARAVTIEARGYRIDEAIIAEAVRKMGVLVVDPASVVVLDPDDPNDQRRLATALNRYDADELLRTDDFLRSLLPAVTPPEPNGLGAVVEDARYGPIVRTHEGHWLDRSHSRVEYLPQQVEEITQHGVGCSCGAPDCNGGES